MPSWTITDAASGTKLLDMPTSAGGQMTAGLPYDLADDTTLEVAGLTNITGERLELVSGYAIAPPVFPASSLRADMQQGDPVPAVLPELAATRMTYETYIPWAFVDAPDTGLGTDCESGDGSNYVYAGDSRSTIVYESPRFRTKGIHEYNWKAKSAWLPRYVLPTKRYIKTASGTYVYESQRTAPMTKFVTNSRANDGVIASGGAVHSVGNPYCADWNSIDYYYTHDVYRTGGYHVFGKHDRMPNHFLYRTEYTSTGGVNQKTIFHHPLKDPKCLNSVYEATNCPQLEYNYEG